MMHDKLMLLKAKGYRVTSRAHLHLSRIDRPDWREEMARLSTPWSIEEGFEWVAAMGSDAEDHYRRCYSKDTVTLPERYRDAVFALIPNSTGSVTGYISEEAK